jgi:hypothetical protein
LLTLRYLSICGGKGALGKKGKKEGRKKDAQRKEKYLELCLEPFQLLRAVSLTRFPIDTRLS